MILDFNKLSLDKDFVLKLLSCENPCEMIKTILFMNFMVENNALKINYEFAKQLSKHRLAQECLIYELGHMKEHYKTLRD